MRRFVRRALVLSGMIVVLSACGNNGDATEQSLIRTATAFSGAPTRGTVVNTPTRPPSVAPPTPRSAASAIVLSTPTPLPALAATSAALRGGSAVTVASATPTPRLATATPTPLVVTVTADSSVNLRTDPASDATVLTQIPSGADLTVVQATIMASDGGSVPWVQVSYDGQMGYVRSDLVGPPHVASASPAATPAASAISGSATMTRVSITQASLPQR